MMTLEQELSSALTNETVSAVVLNALIVRTEAAIARPTPTPSGKTSLSSTLSFVPIQRKPVAPWMTRSSSLVASTLY